MAESKLEKEVIQEVEEKEFDKTPLTKSIRFHPFQTDYKNKEIVVQPSSIGQRLDLNMNNAKGAGGAYVNRVVTLEDDATPSVKNANFFKTGGTTTITDFDDGKIGQEIQISSNHIITITNNINIELRNNENFVMDEGDTLTLGMFDDEIWEEKARSINGTNGTYGSMGQSNVPTTVSIDTKDVAVVLDGMTGGPENNVTFQNAKELKVDTAGIYFVTISISFTLSSGSNKEIEGRIGVNDLPQVLGSTHRKIGTGSDEGAMGANSIFSLSANDRVSVMLQNNTDTVNIVIGHSNLSLIRVG